MSMIFKKRLQQWMIFLAIKIDRAKRYTSYTQNYLCCFVWFICIVLPFVILAIFVVAKKIYVYICKKIFMLLIWTRHRKHHKIKYYELWLIENGEGNRIKRNISTIISVHLKISRCKPSNKNLNIWL